MCNVCSMYIALPACRGHFFIHSFWNVTHITIRIKDIYSFKPFLLLCGLVFCFNKFLTNIYRVDRTIRSESQEASLRSHLPLYLAIQHLLTIHTTMNILSSFRSNYQLPEKWFVVRKTTQTVLPWLCGFTADNLTLFTKDTQISFTSLVLSVVRYESFRCPGRFDDHIRFRCLINRAPGHGSNPSTFDLTCKFNQYWLEVEVLFLGSFFFSFSFACELLKNLFSGQKIWKKFLQKSWGYLKYYFVWKFWPNL